MTEQPDWFKNRRNDTVSRTFEQMAARREPDPPQPAVEGPEPVTIGVLRLIRRAEHLRRLQRGA